MLTQRGKVILAVLASVVLHVLVLLLWALAAQIFRPDGAPASSQPTPPPLKLTLQTEPPTPTPTPLPVTPPPVHFADTTGMVETATPPPETRLQSARDTVAASELPASGEAPVPTQQGKPVPLFTLNTTEDSRGAEPPSPDAAPAATPPPETAPPLPQAAPRATAPPAAPVATPVPKATDFALATPASLPTEPSAEPNPFDPSFRPPSSLTEPPRPTPVSRRDYYRPQPLKTASSGSINNLGTASVASVNTPVGRYQTIIKAAVQRRWNSYIESRMGLMNVGSVTVRFLVGMDGKARAVQVVSNTANEALAAISLRAIDEARIPPMPADAVPATSGGQLPMDLTFELIDQPRL